MNTITLRDGKPAICVKDDFIYYGDERYADACMIILAEQMEQIYENIKDSFWNLLAPRISAKYGFGDVYAEGRSDGWLLVVNPPALDATALEGEGYSTTRANEVASNSQHQWKVFQEEIEQLVKECQEIFIDDVIEAAEKLREEKK